MVRVTLNAVVIALMVTGLLVYAVEVYLIVMNATP
jgi:hypothetical protein